MGSFLPKSAEFLFGTGGGGGSVTVKDEGVVLGTAITSIDFIGPGVTAALSGPGAVTVGIGASPPSFGISSFTNNRNILEIGQSIGPAGTFADILFNFAYSPSAPDTSHSINNGVGAITPLSATSKLFTPGSLITTNTTFTLTAINNALPYTANTTLSFRNKRYWGVSSSDDPSSVIDYASLDAFIDTLSQEFATTRQTTKTFDCTGGKYFYFFFPTSFGTVDPQLQIGPFPVSLIFTDTIVNFENESGHQEDYYVYRSDNLLYDAAVAVTVL